MEFVDNLKAYLEDINGITNTVDISLLGDGNSVCLRPAPSQPPEKYLDSSSNYVFSFQVLVRHTNNRTALQTADKIKKRLDNLSKGQLSGNTYSFVKCNIQVTPSFLEKDSEGWIYTALYDAELYMSELII